LTGSLSQLTGEWNAYGVQVQTLDAGAMVAHSNNAFVIDADGRLRDSLAFDPGPDSATSASLATLLDQVMRAAMRT
jgi:cytochrome oxidase Cu insertion factor (SCO1/SenC/PrrC family)